MNPKTRFATMFAAGCGAALVHLSGYVPLIYGVDRGLQSDSKLPIVLGVGGYIVLYTISVLSFKHLYTKLRQYQLENRNETLQNPQPVGSIDVLVQSPSVED